MPSRLVQVESRVALVRFCFHARGDGGQREGCIDPDAGMSPCANRMGKHAFHKVNCLPRPSQKALGSSQGPCSEAFHGKHGHRCAPCTSCAAQSAGFLLFGVSYAAVLFFCDCAGITNFFANIVRSISINTKMFFFVIEFYMCQICESGITTKI